jgi:beta-glucosidase
MPKILKMKKAIFLFFLLPASIFAVAQNEPYKNAKLSPLERANDVLSRLTLEEKVGLMKDVSQPVSRLGIPEYNWWNEALHGVARAGLATVFPQPIGMAATFNDRLVNNVFTAVSDEARAKFNNFRRQGMHGRYEGLTFWTPNINIFRDPRWGRGHETYGEDPYLTGRMGMAVVRGLQGPSDSRYNKLHACAKHYAVHSGPEWSRHYFNAENIPPRYLWETYLPAFKNLVVDAGVKEVMCAYNRFEGEPCCGSKKLLTDILRTKWKYNNVVVSDCGAINDFYEPNRHGTYPDASSASAHAVISGTDLECGSSYDALVDAVKKGLISEKQIDESVRRLLKARFELGEFDPDSLVSWSSIKYDIVNCRKHQELALEVARESITLLMNKNNILPLKKTGLKIAVMGPNAADSIMQWGNYEGIPAKTITILEGIKMKVPDLMYVKGCDMVGTRTMQSAFNNLKTPDGKNAGLAAEFWNTVDMTGKVVTTRIMSTPLIFGSGGAVFAPGVNRNNFSARYKGIFYPKKDGDVIFSIAGDDGYRLLINNQKVADDWGIHAETSREYKLSVKAGEAYNIEIQYMQAGGDASLKFDLGYEMPNDPLKILASVKDVDVVIFVGGISPKLEGEEMSVNFPGFKGGDRTDIELPAMQREFIQKLKKAGKKIIYINCSGSAVGLVPEVEICDAIIQAWYPGQAGGTAVADVLFGDYNPAGRLPVTFYKNIHQLPDFENYSMKGRTYRYMKEAPLFVFGHGLSYTTFKYGRGSLSNNAMKAGDSTSLSFTLSNTGKYDGDEVVQIYIRNLQDSAGPLKTLRAFQRVNLKAGETKKISIVLPANSFEWFDENTNSMSINPGKYEILFGGTSLDKGLGRLEVNLK